MIIHPDEMEACILGKIGEPHAFLGMHPLSDRSGIVIRTWDPSAKKIQVTSADRNKSFEMERMDDRGFF